MGQREYSEVVISYLGRGMSDLQDVAGRGATHMHQAKDFYDSGTPENKGFAFRPSPGQFQ
ncbi:Uncharacterized protein dnm_017590 [Desulfonema magnum]|uniref:Uncharacterized protein n=1 Tax=Desulfonema magnum TaxID=45655 RepID=A0A975BI52_9BACT|nr:Uncharacterized protein dnm_017590 [Desulfonema magnum]